MRVGLLIDTFNIGGAESMVFETAKLLQANGVEPVLLHFNSPYADAFAKQNGIEQHVIPNRKLYKKTIYLPLFAIRTRKFIRSLQLDCLHTHLFGPIIAFAPLAWMIKLRHVGTLHDVYMIEEAPYRIWLIKLAHFFNTRLIAVSRHMADFYSQRAHFGNDSIQYIPNYSAVNQNLTHRQSIRKTLGLSAEQVAVVSVGRLVTLKRFELLIAAAASIPAERNIKTFIAGDGPQRLLLQDLIEHHDATDRVRLLGERDDIESILAAADIFTLTSESEGMSKSILEALAAQLPVVATDVGGNSDLVIQGTNGYLLEYSEPQEIFIKLAEHLEHLAGNAKLRETMGKASKAILEQDHTAALFLERHLQAYHGEPRDH